MKIITYKDSGYERKFAALRRLPKPDPSVHDAVAEIIADVRRRGDRAVVEIGNRFSPVPQRVAGLKVTDRGQPPAPAVRRALRFALKNVTRFSQQRRPKAWRSRNSEGATVGETYHPLHRVGIYVPGGTAPLLSTAIMTVGVARVAGVPEIVVCSPPPIHPHLLYAIRMAGATEVVAAGGAQAIAALACGTKTIGPVDKIFGPGNAYVVEAKRQLFGEVAIDLLPGPSEVAVVADRTCTPAFVAADLLAQAEHGPGSQIFFLTHEAKVFTAVRAELDRQLAGLGRQTYLEATLKNGCTLVLTRSIEESLAGAELIAPEHLSLACAEARTLANQIRNSGCVFVGSLSPVAAGDYVAGPSHTLPTGGAARMFAGLTVDQFMKRTSLVEYDRASLERAAPFIAALAGEEKLDAHAASVAARLKGGKERL
ncbi:MAG: histidinol dehydrogenase [Candidatus Methylacidiphilales bacterium]